LASPVRDTMKRGKGKRGIGKRGIEKRGIDNNSGLIEVKQTVDRQQLWHGLTPQCAKTSVLLSALAEQIDGNGLINTKVTDEASALEMSGETVLLVEGSSKNIKVTMPDDLALADFYLSSQM